MRMTVNRIHFRHDILIYILSMTSFSKYRLMAQNKKAQILWMDGVYLNLVRHTKRMTIELYALYNYYVEIYFDKVTEEPLFLKSFQSDKSLDPYLTLVSIDEVL